MESPLDGLSGPVRPVSFSDRGRALFCDHSIAAVTIMAVSEKY
jgi:hypothetical protein